MFFFYQGKKCLDTIFVSIKAALNKGLQQIKFVQKRTYITRVRALEIEIKLAWQNHKE